MLTPLFSSLHLGYDKIIIEGVDMMQTAFLARSKKTYGDGPENGGPLSLTKAIEEMLCDGPPQMCVQFTNKQKMLTQKSYDSTGDSGDLQFHTVSGSKEILARWQTDTRSKLSSIGAWLETTRSDDDKGHIVLWNNLSIMPCALITKDNSPDCSDKDNGPGKNDIHLGTYIVNGGQKSNVLSFSANLNFIGGFAVAMQGGTTGNANVPQKDDEGDPCSKKKKGAADMGRQVNSGANKEALDNAYGSDPQVQAKEMVKSIRANKKAGAIYSNIHPIDGELRIQGNPDIRFCDNRIRGWSWVSIVVLNPFYINGVDDDAWHIGNGVGQGMLEGSACNQILSNPNWMILGCTHSIKEGSYHTTLHVKLITPGFDIMDNLPVGGTGGQWNISNEVACEAKQCLDSQGNMVNKPVK